MHHFSIEKACGFISGAIVAVFNGDLLNMHLLNFDFLTWLFTTSLDLVKVGLAGLIGTAAGAAGKKYLFPFAERKFKKLFTKTK